ncbi:MAG: BON domain-containing protein, partial [Desulfobacterales bacterium]
NNFNLTFSGYVDTLSGLTTNATHFLRVKTTLLYHRSTSGLDTTVNTKDGVVTLGGKAGNKAEKDLAGKLVSDVYGVKKVINNMTV